MCRVNIDAGQASIIGVNTTNDKTIDDKKAILSIDL
jgi:hypothetical protein